MRRTPLIALSALAVLAVLLSPGDWKAPLSERLGQWVALANAEPISKPQTLAAKGRIEVAFSPDGGGTALVVKTLGKAKQRVLVQAYSFTSKPIAQALVAAAARGVIVTVVLDKSQRSERYSSADFLRNQGVATFIDDQHAIAHNKVMVIDQDTVITGSFNFTKAAEMRNAENLLVFTGNHKLTALYADNFLFHQAHSTPYQKSETRKQAPDR